MTTTSGTAAGQNAVQAESASGARPTAAPSSARPAKPQSPALRRLDYIDREERGVRNDTLDLTGDVLTFQYGDGTHRRAVDLERKLDDLPPGSVMLQDTRAGMAAFIARHTGLREQPGDPRSTGQPSAATQQPATQQQPATTTQQQPAPQQPAARQTGTSGAASQQPAQQAATQQPPSSAAPAA